MVRTYAFNASSRSEFFEQYKHTAATKVHPDVHNSTSRSQETVPSTYSNDNRKLLPSDSQSIPNSTAPSSMTSSSSQSGIFENNNQFANHILPPIHQSNIYQSSFHSSMIDPIGSIVGLRLVYSNGQLIYVPVEPHINMMINKQFGGQMTASGPQVTLPQIQPNLPMLAQNIFQGVPNIPIEHQMVRSQSRQDVNQNQPNQYNPPQSTQSSAKQQYRNNAMLAKFGSLPNLSQKPFISSQEQHKLELQQQIEDNKRRKALEKQKELELEQREIRKWEEYQKRIRAEDENEKRQIQDKARAIELRNQQVYERQQMKIQNRKNEVPQPRASENYQQYDERQDYQQQQRSQEYQPKQFQQRQQYQQQQQYSDYSSYPEDEEPIRQSQPPRNMPNLNRNPENNQQPNSRPVRNQPRYEQQYEREVSREPRPDSSKPRQQEWWEKKPSWQEKAIDRQSAVIPTLRGKPPAVPDSQRSGYDSSGNVGDHQSRPSSRTTSSSQRSSDSQSEEPPRRHQSGARKAPTAFTAEA